MDIILYEPKYFSDVIALDEEAMEDFEKNKIPEDFRMDLINAGDYYSKEKGSLYAGILNNDIIAMGGFHYMDSFTAELKRMRVKKSLRGRGLGSEMLIFLEHVMKDRGIKKIVLETAQSRTLPLKFYEKFGYQRQSGSHFGGIPVVKYYKLL